MHLLTQAKSNVSALELERHLGACSRTAWLVGLGLLEVMRLREEGRLLTGRVEIAAEMGAVHDRTVTGGGKACVALDPFTAVDILFGNRKTAMSGTYQAIKFAKHAVRYLGEVQYRFNRRDDLRSILARLVKAAGATGPIRESTIRVAEVHRQSGPAVASGLE